VPPDVRCTKFDFRWGSATDPVGGAHSAPADSLAVFTGALFVRREGKGRRRERGGEGERKGCRKREGRWRGMEGGREKRRREGRRACKKCDAWGPQGSYSAPELLQPDHLLYAQAAPVSIQRVVVSSSSSCGVLLATVLSQQPQQLRVIHVL